LPAAVARASTAGLHLVTDTSPPPSPIVSSSPSPSEPVFDAQSAAQLPGSQPTALPALPPASAASSPASPPVPKPLPIHNNGGVILTQYPQPGRRVVQGDAVHITLGLPTQVVVPLSP
jgi:hypothetical protein